MDWLQPVITLLLVRLAVRWDCPSLPLSRIMYTYYYAVPCVIICGVMTCSSTQQQPISVCLFKKKPIIMSSRRHNCQAGKDNLLSSSSSSSSDVVTRHCSQGASSRSIIQLLWGRFTGKRSFFFLQRDSDIQWWLSALQLSDCAKKFIQLTFFFLNLFWLETSSVLNTSLFK